MLEKQAKEDSAVTGLRVDSGPDLGRVQEHLGQSAAIKEPDAEGESDAAVLKVGQKMRASVSQMLAGHVVRPRRMPTGAIVMELTKPTKAPSVTFGTSWRRWFRRETVMSRSSD